jgi:hypothetical protein
VLKLEPRPGDTFLERDGLGSDEVLVDVVQLLVRLARVLERRLDKVGLRQVEVDVRRRVDKERVEALAGPLEAEGRRAKATLVSGCACRADHGRRRGAGRTSIVCSIALGNDLSVHIGMLFSGGSWLDE